DLRCNGRFREFARHNVLVHRIIPVLAVGGVGEAGKDSDGCRAGRDAPVLHRNLDTGVCQVGKGRNIGGVGGRQDDNQVVGGKGLDRTVDEVPASCEFLGVGVTGRDEDICIGAVLHLGLKGLGAV